MTLSLTRSSKSASLARMAAGEEFFGNLAGVTKAFFRKTQNFTKLHFCKAYAINKTFD